MRIKKEIMENSAESRLISDKPAPTYTSCVPAPLQAKPLLIVAGKKTLQFSSAFYCVFSCRMIVNESRRRYHLSSMYFSSYTRASGCR